MRVYIVIYILFYGNLIFALPKNFIILQKESVSGVEQVSLAEEDKAWTYTSNTDSFTNSFPYFLGHYKVKLSSADIIKLKFIIKESTATSTQKKLPTFKHVTRYFVNGKEIQNNKIEEEISQIFISIADRKKLTPLNALIIKKISDEIEYEKWSSSQQIENTKKEPLKFCSQLINEICSVDLGLIRISKVSK